MPFDRQQILRLLEEEVRAARAERDKATQQADALYQDVPSGIPAPDSVLRIKQVSRDLSMTRQRVVEAYVRLNAFVTQGIVPDHLKEHLPNKDAKGKSGKKDQSQAS